MKKEPLIFYQYSDVTDTDYFRERLMKEFRETGHDREVDFRVWNCYREPPGVDGDVFSYDTVMLSTLCDMGLIRELPEEIRTNGIFPWITDTSMVRGRCYSIPFMTCATMLICRAKDYHGKVSIYDLKGRLVTPLRSVILNYYFEAYCNYQDCMGSPAGNDAFSVSAISVLKQLMQLMGGKESLLSSLENSEEWVGRFIRGDAAYFMGFSEYLRLFDGEDYAVDHICLSHLKESPVPFFYTDVLSVSPRAEGEKLRDCMDLMSIMTSEAFLYDICVPNGVPSYMLPANEAVFQKLAQRYKLYEKLYEITANPLNCCLRFGNDYYTKWPAIEKALIDAVKSI